MRKLIALMLAFFFLLGCSTTIIKSKPSEAKLYLNREFKGLTPYTHSDMDLAGTTKEVKLEKEGFKDFTGYIKRSRPSVLPIIGGFIFIVPFLWATEYPPEYTFQMEKLESKPSDLTTKPQVTPPEKPATSAPATPSMGIEKTVIWTSANIRSGAGDNYSVVTTVKQGDKLTVIGELGEWFNVRLENGQQGWISNRVVK
jgi:hypothetical protein